MTGVYVSINNIYLLSCLKVYHDDRDHMTGVMFLINAHMGNHGNIMILSPRFLAGCIPREKLPAFERMLWFACRGNVFLRYEEIQQPMEDPVTVRNFPI